LTAGTKRLVIRLEEGVRFSRELASPITRMLAVLVDLLVMLVFMGIVSRLAFAFAPALGDVGVALYYWAGFVIMFGYPLLTEWLWGGQTVGKKLLRLRVVDAGGLHLRFPQILIRNLLRPVDQLPAFYLVGGLVAFFSPTSRRLGDLAANTVVIRLPRQILPDLEQIAPTKYNSLRADRPLAARLRQRIEPDLAGVLMELVLRRDILLPESRLTAFAAAATVLRRLGRVPDEIAEQLTDEQLVRNTVDLLFRQEIAGAGILTAVDTRKH